MGVSGTCYNHFTIYINRTIMLYAFVNCSPVKLGRGGGRIVLATSIILGKARCTGRTPAMAEAFM